MNIDTYIKRLNVFLKSYYLIYITFYNKYKNEYNDTNKSDCHYKNDKEISDLIGLYAYTKDKINIKLYVIIGK
jgi:hypothetical protein